MGYIEDLRKLIGHKRIVLNGSLVIIENKDGKILMQKRTYPKGKWGLPGGLMELGESTVETAVREVREETNLTVENLKLLGVYSGKDHLCKAENGDEWYVVVTAYTTKDFSGTLMINDGESEGSRVVLSGRDTEKHPVYSPPCDRRLQKRLIKTDFLKIKKD